MAGAAPSPRTPRAEGRGGLRRTPARAPRRRRCRACDADLVRGGGASRGLGGAPLLRLRGRFHRRRRARGRLGAAAAAVPVALGQRRLVYSRSARPGSTTMRHKLDLGVYLKLLRWRKLHAARATAIRRRCRARRRPGQARHARVLWRRVHVLYDPSRAGRGDLGPIIGAAARRATHRRRQVFHRRTARTCNAAPRTSRAWPAGRVYETAQADGLARLRRRQGLPECASTAQRSS